MSNITSKLEFDHLSATLCGLMVSCDSSIRRQAAKKAIAILAELPAFLRNSPHCQGEIEAINTLITRVAA